MIRAVSSAVNRVPNAPRTLINNWVIKRTFFFSNNDKEANEKLHMEVHELRERVMRSYAEEENVRRIARRDVENAKAFANTSFAKALLEVADDLDLAMASVPKEKRHSTAEEDKTLTTLYQGIELTDKNLVKVFAKFGIRKFAEVGDKFDPDLHNALFSFPDTNKPPGTIGQVLKSGYMLHDRVIRAADVGTVQNPNEA